MSAKILDFKPQQNGQLVGFADVEFATGWQLFGVVIIKGKDGDLVALPPGKPQIDSFGKVRLKPNGKTDYISIIKFKSQDVRRDWSKQIVAALKESYSGVLS